MRAMDLLKSQLSLVTSITNIKNAVFAAERQKVTSGFLRSQIRLLSDDFHSLRSNHLELVSKDAIAGEPYFTENQFDSTRAVYIETLSHLYDEQDRVDRPVTSLTPESPALQTAVARSQTNLPRINLPAFSGLRGDWEPFRDLFRSMVHDDTTFSPVQKLYYLKGAVQGAAKSALDTIPTTESNYATAWKLLLSRYDSKRLLLQDHLQTITAMNPLKRESAEGLQTLLDTLSQRRQSLSPLIGCPIENWDPLFTFVTSRAMDPVTRRDWENQLGEEDVLSTFSEIQVFLQKRIRALKATETLHPPMSEFRSRSTDSSWNAQPGSRLKSRLLATSINQPCVACNSSHYIGHCPEWHKLNVATRRQTAIRSRLCFNCLQMGHFSHHCPSRTGCRLCQKPHHSTLHEDITHKRPLPAHSEPSTSKKIPQVAVKTSDGHHLRARALLDPGSETSFISRQLVRRLGLPQQVINIPISTVGNKHIEIARRCVTLHLESRQSLFPVEVSTLVLRDLGVITPSEKVADNNWHHIQGLPLADPNFLVPKPIDVLLGADVYGSLILDGIRQGSREAPVALRTVFGWVVIGPVGCSAPSDESKHSRTIMTLSVHQKDNLASILKRFWEQEEVNIPPLISREDQDCERAFIDGHRRDSTGRYIVRLPLRSSDIHNLGESLQGTKRILESVCQRLEKDTLLNEEYTRFMSDYERLGHMRLIPPAERLTSSRPAYYIPHHAVWKNADGRPKLRIVFNASQKTSSGLSLNNLLHTGPKLQNDLTAVLMRWRFPRIVFCADVEMMYRQIRVDERDVDLQRIVWRKPGANEDSHYQLLTLTYGMSCAPYLAIRTLQQLATDEASSYPAASELIRKNIYVDDILSGASDEASAIKLRDQLIQLLKSGGMHLRKWASNYSPLLCGIPECDRLRKSWLQFETDGPINALGVAWDPVSDEFRFKAPAIDHEPPITKRKVLAAISRLFDPVGWLSPITVVAKILMQDLWKAQVGWDAPLPHHLLQRWTTFQTNLTEITTIHCPRWIGYHPADRIEIHGFGDASQHAFAAVVYVRVQSSHGTYKTQLLTSKTRVAPVKTITIPKLELCAAVLVVRLIHYVREELELPHAVTYAWSDSRNVLSWIKTADPSRWPIYVANRVSEIQRTLSDALWHYVPTKENPADVATRGMEPRALAQKSLWWNGPEWLSQSESYWPSFQSLDEAVSTEDLQSHDEEFEQPSIAVRHARCHLTMISTFSSLTRLTRVIARCLRFKLLLKHAVERSELMEQRLTPEEIHRAFLACVSCAQGCSFKNELTTLRQGRTLEKQSKLVRLHPFIDPTGILRVGGRLANSPLPYDQRHPVILHGDSPLAQLIIDWAHRTALHGGFQLTYSYAVRRAWIIRGRVSVKAHIRHCIPCTRARVQKSEQLMGNLPAERVTVSFPFEKTGVDYAGPFAVKRTIGRGYRTTKGYIALFICLSSKAVHLEVVGDLTTQSFLAALRRLAGRRGTPREMWSDNATTFHGADAELRSMLREAEIDWNLVQDSLANRGIKWKFIPPSAPHFGGLWESNIKSAKSLMKKVVGTQNLTYEELSTLAVEIEACMNSRPLLPITGDPEDLDVLTPSHALLGRTLEQIPRATTSDREANSVTHWRLVQAMRDQFWKRWSHEYLHTLQQRNKWTLPKRNLQIGDVVLIVDPSLLRRGTWPLGRITNIRPGEDGLVRAATVKTSFGTYDRPIVKLCWLPVVR